MSEDNGCSDIFEAKQLDSLIIPLNCRGAFPPLACWQITEMCDCLNGVKPFEQCSKEYFKDNQRLL